MIKEVDVGELDKILQKNPDAKLIDVREEDEFNEVHASKARLYPLSEFEPKAVAENFGLTEDEEFYIICKSGGRSMRAAELLYEIGYTKAVNVKGGTLQWVASGLPVG